MVNEMNVVRRLGKSVGVWEWLFRRGRHVSGDRRVVR